ncbi:hypothetical protein C4573_01210 [Candidatus Woesearchaeota archaeon]|nr:MAG: hypothetical protein C4573_01210 [Candidatus Woesearchaeota archaeon]
MKAQIAGQIFIYILAIIVVGIIILIGYRYIGKLTALKCDAEISTFGKQINDAVEQYDAYGSLGNIELAVPCKYQEVCFVDAAAVESGNSAGIDNGFIKQSVESKIQMNVFLLGDNLKPVSYNAHIIVPETMVCIDADGKQFFLELKGLNGKTSLNNSAE